MESYFSCINNFSSLFDCKPTHEALFYLNLMAFHNFCQLWCPVFVVHTSIKLAECHNVHDQRPVVSL
jgi:hypothetical protein